MLFYEFLCKINIRGDLLVFIVMLGFKKRLCLSFGVIIVLKSRAVG